MKRKKVIKTKSFIESKILKTPAGFEPTSPDWLVIEQKSVPMANNIYYIFTKNILN